MAEVDLALCNCSKICSMDSWIQIAFLRHMQPSLYITGTRWCFAQRCVGAVSTLSSHGVENLVTKAKDLLLRSYSTLTICRLEQKELPWMPQQLVDWLLILDKLYSGCAQLPLEQPSRTSGHTVGSLIHWFRDALCSWTWLAPSTYVPGCRPTWAYIV